MTDWYDRATQPRFQHPPVVEAVMSLEWAAIPTLGVYQLARIQDLWIDRYPLVQDFTGAPSSQLVQPTQTQGVQLQFGGVPPVRLWASNPDTGMLAQTQADRLVLNWRDEARGIEYPGYDELRVEYRRLWTLLTEFLQEHGLQTPVPVLAQYTYLNIVDLAETETMADVVSVVRTPEHDLPGRELLTRFQFIRDVDKSVEHPMAAQIVVTGEPQISGEQRSIALNVDTRAIFDGTQDDALTGVDVAHALSSYTFDRIIATPKRTSWGQQ